MANKWYNLAEKETLFNKFYFPECLLNNMDTDCPLPPRYFSSTQLTLIVLLEQKQREMQTNISWTLETFTITYFSYTILKETA